ncbi:Serine/threonine-protein kinase PknB [Anatilimnocola aggregata]|uniref:Serine/threonine-protein kinase PknB n=1 Tax=Anatilimnocola aggregata TaxID=2528021 RepID=A0A517YK02_9BACT|nr:serine/threonine-protein kinase [Anatilimnocola aggregata]QDU30547.1 Serine/threonine-protein kinase PknB [Anatilimnocola aggregata]
MQRSEAIVRLLAEHRGALLSRQFDPSTLLAAHRELLPELATAIEDLLSNSSLLSGAGETQSFRAADPAGTLNWDRIDIHEAATATAGAKFGPFELVRVLGEGAFGVVWLARQPELERDVALKILRAQFASSQTIERFWQEAKVLARLKHPYIVQVLSVGTVGSEHYIAMEFVPGGDLRGRLQAAVPSAAWSAAVLQKVALAVEHAHQANVIHRDLKPANILLNGEDEPFVTDFGLAKRLENGPELTASGDVLGTIAYMSPEQASGQTASVNAQSDVYSLGATLYHLLTGRRPFPLTENEPLQQTLADIRERDPQPLRRLNATLPVELETICLKSLEKDPTRRYATAGALAADLGRFLAGEPILGKATRWPERLWRAVRRRPLFVGSLISGAAVLLILVSTIWNLAARGQQLGQDIKTKEESLQTAQQELLATTTKVSQAEQVAQERKAESEQVRAGQRWTNYLAAIQEIHAAWDEGQLARMRELLQQQVPAASDSTNEDLRGIEWYYWQSRLDNLGSHIPTTAICDALAISPDGLLVAGCDETHVRIWNIESKQKIFDQPIGRPRSAGVLDSYTQFLTPPAVAFSPDGKWIAGTTFHLTRDNRRLGFLRVWNVASGDEHFSVTNDRLLGGRAVAFSPDSQFVLAGGLDSYFRCWKLETKQEELPAADERFARRNLQPRPPPTPGTATGGAKVVRDLQFCSDGKTLLCRSDWTGPEFILWKNTDHEAAIAEDYRQLQQKLRGHVVQGKTLLGEFRDNLFAAHLNEGRNIELHLYEGPKFEGPSKRLLEGHDAMCLQAGEKYFAVGSNDQLIRVWDLAFLEPVRELRGHTAVPSCLVFGKQDGMLASRASDGIRVWNLQAESNVFVVDRSARSDTASFLHRGKRGGVEVETNGHQQLSVKFLDHFREKVTIHLPELFVLRTVLSDDDSLLAVVVRRLPGSPLKPTKPEPKTLLFRLPDGEQVAELPPATLSPIQLAFSPTSEYLAIGRRIWKTDTMTEVGALPEQAPNRQACFSPSGRYLALSDATRTEIYDVLTNTQVCAIPRGGSAFSFSRDEQQLYLASPAISAWEIASGQEIEGAFGKQPYEIVELAADGRRVYARRGKYYDVFSVEGSRLLFSTECKVGFTTAHLEKLFTDYIGRLAK